jgi:hypothetical protein
MVCKDYTLHMNLPYEPNRAHPVLRLYQVITDRQKIETAKERKKFKTNLYDITHGRKKISKESKRRDKRMMSCYF